MSTKNVIERKTIEELRIVVKAAANASTKADATQAISKALYLKNMIRPFIDDYAEEKLQEALRAAERAAGKVKNKERLIEDTDSCFYRFERVLTLR